MYDLIFRLSNSINCIKWLSIISPKPLAKLSNIMNAKLRLPLKVINEKELIKKKKRAIVPLV